MSTSPQRPEETSPEIDPIPVADARAIRSALTQSDPEPSPALEIMFDSAPAVTRSRRSRFALTGAAASIAIVAASMTLLGRGTNNAPETIAASVGTPTDTPTMSFVAPATTGSPDESETSADEQDPPAPTDDREGFWYCVFVPAPAELMEGSELPPGDPDVPPVDDCVTIDGFEPMSPEELAELFPEFGPIVDLADRFPEGFGLPDGFEFPEGFDPPALFDFPDLFELPEGFELPDDFEGWEFDQLPELFEFPDPSELAEAFEFELPEGFEFDLPEDLDRIDPEALGEGCHTFENSDDDGKTSQITICLNDQLFGEGDLAERLDETKRRFEEFFERVFRPSTAEG